MKRSVSCDSDNDDFFDDVDDRKTGSPTQSGHVSDRKRRRGVIEKRRRDRINNSLSELRRLVPAAFEKQGSAKLEKAEILQMTVDHLKMLHAKGVGGYNLDTAALAMDYRTVGFRECAAEVARYLVTMEGLDIQDPLRLRLMSHLQCYCAQREAAAKASVAWTPAGSHLGTGSYGPSQTQHVGITSQTEQLTHHALPSYVDVNSRMTSHHPHHHGHLENGGSGGGTISSAMRLQASSVQMSIGSGGATQSVLSSLPTQFFGVNGVSMLSPSSGHYGSPTSVLGQGMKPYRPWGAELVY